MKNPVETRPDHPTYLNPVFKRDFPDPFILKFSGEYWAYCSSGWPDGRRFGILHSTDLVHWQELPGALEPLPGHHTCYWAPEVSYYNGQFYMYYSVGNEEYMHIRVALASQPGGPFVDSGYQLTTQQFAIDPHIYTEEDGSRYLFYATDFLQHTHIGTGTVMDRLLDPFRLEGQPRPVVRARYDWQVYDPQRVNKGGVRWHTIEGPFVLKRKNKYYEMFSGGNWQNVSYGVSYALSDQLTNPEEWRQAADGRQVLPILRTIPGLVIGPGHNSVVRGPDNRQLYCVYHRWAEDGSGREMAIDPLDWAGERMLVIGPSYTPRPVPNSPALSGFDRPWQSGPGLWQPQGHFLRQESASGPAWYGLDTPLAHYLAEVTIEARPGPGADWQYGLALTGPNGAEARLLLDAQNKHLVHHQPGTQNVTASRALPPDFDLKAAHTFRWEVDARRMTLRLEEWLVYQALLPFEPQGLNLITTNTAAEFKGFSLTPGWEDLFTGDYLQPTGVPENWQSQTGGSWQMANGELAGHPGGPDQVISRGPLLENYELVVNARTAGAETTYGFYPLYRPGQPGPLLRLEPFETGWALRSQEQVLALPPGFDPTRYQQFRLLKEQGRLAVSWENTLLGEMEVAPAPSGVGLYATGAAAFEMVRVTSLHPAS